MCDTDLTEALPHVSEFRRIVRVLLGRRIIAFCLIIILALIVIAIFAPQIAPYDPYAQDLSNRLLGSSSEHLLGTDYVGRDTLSRMIYGSQTALMVGLVAICIAASIGITLGLIAGYFGGISYVIIMRLVDALMSIPLLVNALVLAVLLGGGLQNVMLAVGIGMSSTYTRLMCAMTLTVKQNDYITAAKAVGASNLRVMFRHCLPNCLPPFIVLMTINMGSAIMIEAALSYLGVGIDPPGAAWGSMIKEGVGYLTTNPILAISPGIAIMLVVYAFNLVGDGLRDALDPRLRGST
jgi:peptide/nickel transport system permease protein